MADVVRIWRIALDAPPRLARRLAAALTPAERDRAATYADPVLGRTFLTVRAAARLALGEHLAVPPHRVPLTTGPCGKPEVDGRPVHFNVSHTWRTALLALCATREVGVDIEHDRYRHNAVALANRFLPGAEAAAVAAGGSTVYLGLLVRKEACVKAAGGRLVDGLRLPVGTPVVADPHGPLPGPWAVRDLPAPAGYAAAVALVGPDRYRVRMCDWHPARALSAGTHSARGKMCAATPDLHDEWTAEERSVMTEQDVALRQVIGEMMGRVLVRDPLTAEEDFFDCGGDSVRAVEVLQLVADRIAATEDQRAELLEALFDDASPAALAAVLTGHELTGHDSVVAGEVRGA